MNYAAAELDAMIEQALLEIPPVVLPVVPPMPAATATLAPTPAPTPARLHFDDNLHYTDVDNGNRLIQAFGNDIRYCHEQNTWFVWTGKYWQANGELLLQEKMKEIANELWVRSIEQSSAAMAKMASDLRNGSDISGAIKMAMSTPSIKIKTTDFNTNRYLVNFTNGTLNLETNQFYAHRSSDLLTKMLDYAYDTNAVCRQWLQFLDEVFPNEHAAVIPFLQAAIGYSLSGLTKERCLFLLHGVGANGKSVFLTVLRSVLGAYACNADWDSFVQKQNNGVRNDLARLEGFRFVTANESAKEARLAEGTVKTLTGGSDSVTARHLYKGFFDFEPQFKLWLATNHKPTISTDTAIWDRLRLIPFTVRFEEAQQDKNLASKLKSEAAGIIRWSIAGFQRYQAIGLPKTAEIEAATSAYQAEQNPVASFLSTCVIDEKASTKRSDLYQAYQQWTMENDEKLLSQKDFAQRVRERGITEKRTKEDRFWVGISLGKDTEIL